MSTLLDLFKTMEYGPAPESPAAVNAWLDERGRKFGLFINNEWVMPKGAKYYPSYNPATGELLAETVQAGKKEVDAAVAAAAGIGSITAYFLTLRHIRAAKDVRGETYAYPTPALHQHEE